MSSLRYHALLIVTAILGQVAATTRAADTKPAAKPAPPAALSPAAEAASQEAVLQSNTSTQAQKLAACKRLGAIGGKESVAALTPLLTDPSLSHPARLGLEAIPDPAATDALRRALPQLKARLLVGAIHSLGSRRDPAATTDLIPRLGDADPEVASAAAFSLGKIATPPARQALVDMLPKAPAAVRPALGDACLAAAESLFLAGKLQEAAAIYRNVRSAEIPQSCRRAALRGELLARQPGWIDLLTAELRAQDDASFATAIEASAQLPGPELTHALVASLPALPEPRQVVVIETLGVRADPAARPAILELAGKSRTAAAVRIEALRTLTTVGDASAATCLLDAAANSNAAIAAVARDTLVFLPDVKLDGILCAALEEACTQQAHKASRHLYLELASRRRIAAALSWIVKAADDPEEPLRVAALRALGRMMPPRDLSMLTKRLLTKSTPGESAAIQEAIRTICVRAADKDACVDTLAATIPSAPSNVRQFLYASMGVVGGPKALQTISAAAKDPNPETADQASRVLGEWHSPDAAVPLLELARKSPDPKLQARAVRGYLHIVRRFDVGNARRVVMCHDAMAAAQRDEEKLLVLGTLERFPAAAAMTEAALHLETPSLREAAASACVAIAEMIVASEREAVAKTMPKVLAATKNADLVRRVHALEHPDAAPAPRRPPR